MLPLMMIVYALIGVGVLALVSASVLYASISLQSLPKGRAASIAKEIHAGALIFMRREYEILMVFVIGTLILSWVLLGWPTAVAYAVGASTSAISGFVGMQSATRANIRAALAARDRGIGAALRMGFTSGAVIGLLIAGLGLLGVVILVLILGFESGPLDFLIGFGLGASSVALFARVGGGIYTKSADVGADLVGKIEVGIPEDDARNPAVIADNVGDIVGDIAGMGADIYESYVNSMIAAMMIGIASITTTSQALADQATLVLLPLLASGCGIPASAIGMGFVRVFAARSPAVVMRLGLFVAQVLFLLLFWVALLLFDLSLMLFWPALAGSIGGLVIGITTEIFTGGSRVRDIAKAGRTGAATVIIAGLALGMHSVTVPLLTLGGVIIIASEAAGLYGVALAAVCMLSTVAMVMAIDAFGPVLDNAGGIVQMAELGAATREVTDSLDAVGNTTAAIGKGFATGAAALTALALVSAYATTVVQRLPDFSLLITDPKVLAGLFCGGLLPFVFSATTMNAVGEAASEIVEEVRRQFRTIPGLLEGRAQPDQSRCMKIATDAALKRMLVPGMIALVAPLIVGFGLGPHALGGMLGGALITGIPLALLMANAGAAWDNAKKYVEQGNLGGKGSAVHSACVIGDTVGDPFKDTSGPSINILIKVMGVTSLLIAPYI